MKAARRSFYFYIIVYFFLLLNIVRAEPPYIPIFTIGIDPQIYIEDMEYEEIRKSVRDACYSWNDTKLVKFVYNKYPQIIIRSKQLTRDRIGQFDPKYNTVDISTKIYPEVNYRPWNRRLLKSVICHELGHSIGLSHNKNSKSIMYHQSNWVEEPTALDVEELKKVLRYRRNYW